MSIPFDVVKNDLLCYTDPQSFINFCLTCKEYGSILGSNYFIEEIVSENPTINCDNTRYLRRRDLQKDYSFQLDIFGSNLEKRIIIFVSILS